MNRCDDDQPAPVFQMGELTPEDATTVEELKQEIEDLEKDIEDCALKLRQLLEEEVRSGSNHAQEIFELKQKKMMLGTEIQHRKVRINLILLNA